MRISELVAHLNRLEAEHGDLEVFSHDAMSTVYGAITPSSFGRFEIRNIAKLAPREHVARVTTPGDPEWRGTGRKILRVV